MYVFMPRIIFENRDKINDFHKSPEKLIAASPFKPVANPTTFKITTPAYVVVG
jgi:hypothetical protein